MENLPCTYDEFKLLLKAFELSGQQGWPSDKDEQVRARVLQDKIRKRMAILEKDRWRGFNQ